MKVSVGVSARHIHVTKETLEILFGKGYELESVRPLSQPGQFASSAKLEISTEKGSFKNVRILGPLRSYNQIEIAKTDAYKLGLNPPMRESGDVKGSAPIKLIGPKGEIDLEEGCIIATRHIHVTPSDIKEKGLEGISKVKLLVPGEKGGILNNVSLKVHESFAFELHLDTDDANAHFINQGDELSIIVE